ncbi:sushi, von Willebrand factor type A, EGF and pentraxin domain-containing protein 1-like isoform X2 [Haliotis rufescens]|uniref:sushi, von Willebrand factor type A, EGF and pentraxin domain-containing protein 1-like isoform X2 n=1 Tax=Haliotis rufescens TaxID=6454 RepID=UPI00201F514B|nr:sushi, von Willebrand factor type A, EGF and pentraxin domain-containing protein 1-like isoform X2 [Haliotis rufescens]
MARSILLCLILYVAVADSGILTKDLHRIQYFESRDGCAMLDRFDSDVQCKGNVHDVFSVAGQVMTMADTGTVCRAGITLDFFACKGGLWVQVPVSFARSLKRRENQHHREKRFWGLVSNVIGAISGVVSIVCTFVCDNGGGGGGGGSPNTFPQIDCPNVGPQYAKTGDTMVVTWTEPEGTDKEDGSLSPKRSGLAPGSEFIASTHFIKYRVVDSGGLSADCEIVFSVHTIHCSPLMYPRNGRLHCTNRDISGSVCTFDCDDGHNVDGASSITCVEGTWSGVEPRCKAVSCGTPPSVTNGQLTCLGDVVYGTYCLMSCNRGFEPRGMMMSTCLAAGHWTPPGTCADVTPPSFTNGCPDDVDDYAEKKGGSKVVTWDDPAVSDNSGPGVTITGSHQSGAAFELGETKVRLTATDAEGNTDQCSFRVTINGLYCPEPDLQDPIDKLRYDCPDGYSYGFSCSLSCHSGFPLQGPDSILCQKDPNVFPATASWTWAVDAFKPFCKNTSCPDLAVPKNGALACDGWGSGGSMCSMLCNEDYDVARDVPDIYTCGQQSGNWFPSDNILDCDRKLRPGSMKLRSDFFYYSGSCHDNNTQLEIAQKFIHILNSSNTFTDVCGAAVPECRVEFVNIQCGETGRRKRSVKRSASEIFLTKVKRSTVPTVIIFEVIVPFNIGSKEDAEAARTRVEGELDNVNKAIDQMLDGGGLSMAEYGLNTQADSFYPGYAAFSCPFGTAENYKHVSCSGCSTGTYVEAGSGNCVSCPVGTYTDEGFSDACKLCGEGKSTRSTESRSVNDCIDTCTEGSFSMDGMAPCTPCSPGTYQDAVAMTLCTSCPTGTTSPQGSHNASSCVAFDLTVHANTDTVFGNITSDLSALTMYFWYRLDTSLGHTLARITDTDRNTVMELSITNNVFLNIQGNSVDTGVTPPTNRWQHLTLTLDGSSKNIALYLNGNAVYSDNVASLTTPIVPRDSSVAIVSGNGDVTQSGINIIERVASLDDIQAQSSSCVSTLQESVLTFIKNGTNLIVPSQCDAVDGCVDNPCGSHPCKDELEGFTCDCQDSWTGVTCNVPPDHCAHHECQNNAICENGNGNYTCQCLKGFKGELCQELVVNGNWGDWSKKTECSASCGGGTRSRSRQCDSPPPDVDGDTCDGVSVETEQCNTDACPECPILRLSSGNLKNCTESDGYTRCTITCRGDMVFYEKPLPVYECGAGSDYVWNHQEHKSNARPPACRTAMGATRYDVTHTVTYQDLPCSSDNSRSDEIKSQVSGNTDVLPCVQESICTTSVSINNCNNNGVSKRSTTSTVVSIIISTIMGDSDSLDLTEFVENNIVTTGLTNYLNKLMKTELSVQTLVNSSNTLLLLTIDGATYQVDTNSMSTTSLAICPSGTTPTEGVCGQCPPGTKEVSGKCVLCEKGTYQHEAASASCRMCPSSTTTPGVGADDVSQCTVSDEEADSERDHEPQWKIIAIGLSCLGGACFIAVAVIIVVKKKGYCKIQKSSSRPSTAGSFYKMFHHRVSVASLPPPYSQEEPQMPLSSTSAFRTQILVMEAPEKKTPIDQIPPLKCTFQ